MTMDPYQAAAFASNQLDRELAMSMILNASSAAPAGGADPWAMARLGGSQYGAASAFGGFAPPLMSAAAQDMFRLQRQLLDREIATRAAFGSSGAEAPFYLRGAGGLAAAQQHPSLSSLLDHPTPGSVPGSAAAMAAVRAAGSPGSSPSLKPMDAPGHHQAAGPAEPTLKRAASSHESAISAAMTARRDSWMGVSTLAAAAEQGAAAAKRPRLGSSPSSPGSGAPQLLLFQRGSKAKLRDDFWGKVGKNNSHIHLVNIVLGRLLHDQVQNAKVGNKVLSNGLIQQILDHKLYGKYAVREFFASSNKASETVRNTWTRLNFSSDNISKGLSRYKAQTWQAIERCGFEDASKEDRAEMDEALKVFAKTRRFVNALDVALKGIITEQFMGVLMQLRVEWNSLCLNCRPEEHDSIVAAFLRKYGMTGK